LAHYSRTQHRERTRLRHAVEYGLLRAVALPLEWLPLRAALWIGRRLGDFTYGGLRLRQRVALENLRAALGPELDNAELSRIARATYQHAGMTFVEFLRFGREGRAGLMDRTTVRPLAVLEQATVPGHGIIYLTSHTGNWELCGVVMGGLGGSVDGVVGDQKNLWVDRYVKRLRGRAGVQMIPIGSALREVMRRLGAGGRVVLAADQDGGRDGVLLDFLGRPASCQAGPARFAYRSGAAVVVCLDRHLGDGRHEILLHQPIVPRRDLPEGEEVARILSESNRHLEAFVRRYPDQWFWMHRRWKSGTERVAAGESVCVG
jgi:KDO2-lipid IV(A) lauroyltransferase